MPKVARKKSKTSKKSARVTAKPKPAARSAKGAKTKPARKKAAPKIDPLNRKGYRSVTPMLAVANIGRAIEFYKAAFGFSTTTLMDTPSGIMHAELTLRDMKVMLSPENPRLNDFSANSIGNTPVTLYVMVDNVDQVFGNAVAAGGRVLMRVANMFWGDRCGVIADPDGNKWMLATHVSEPTEAEMAAAMQAQ